MLVIVDYVETCLHPWSTDKPVECCITLVQSLYTSCYVSLNNGPVLSHLLLRLLPQLLINVEYEHLEKTVIKICWKLFHKIIYLRTEAFFN
jgi:hypothetical protein